MAMPSPYRKERAEPAIAQEQPSPYQDAEIDREQGITEQRIADAQVGRYGTAEIAREKDRTEYRGSRDHVYNGTDEQDKPDDRNSIGGISDFDGRFHNSVYPHQFGNAVEKQKENYNGADYAPGPKLLFGNRSKPHCICHVVPPYF